MVLVQRSMRTVVSCPCSPSESSPEPFVALGPPHHKARNRRTGIHAVAMRMPPLPPGSSGSAAPSRCRVCGRAHALHLLFCRLLARVWVHR